MAFHLSKFLQEFLYPFNLSLLALLVSLVCLRKGKTRWTAGLIVAAFLLLAIPGMPILGDSLVAVLESYYPPKPIEAYPQADAIVALGGTVPPTIPPRYEAEETGGARLLQAARLFRLGRAPYIVVAGGLRYKLPDGTERSEADDMTDVFLGMGIPRSALVLEDQSRNTYENAVNTAKILQERKAKTVLLVTSATHMKRAMALFEKQGVEAIAVPTCISSMDQAVGVKQLLPTPSGVGKTTIAVKELAGHFVYWLVGKS